MASSTSPFPYMPISQITLPDTAIIRAASAYAKKHSTEAVYNHCVRSAYWALLLAGRLTRTNQKDSEEEKPYLDAELVVLACILHDMGWSSDKESLQLSTWKRFEVDGADVARRFIQEFRGKGGDDWGRERIQRVWDAIALHTTSIATFGSPEVATAHLGIRADFIGPLFPTDPWADPSLSTSPKPGAVITIEEFKEVAHAFPYGGFGKEGVKQILCGLCRDKPASTFDNFVSNFGREFGFDGRGEGREEYTRDWAQATNPGNLLGGFAYLERLLKEE